MNLILPPDNKPNSRTHPNGLPQEERFTTKMFICHYKSDVESFEKIVNDLGGNFCGSIKTDFLNVWNQAVGFGQYVCIYQFNKDIEMEVLC